MSNNKKVSTDLQGVTRLITKATIGITDLTEAMQKQIVHPAFLPSTPIQHLVTKISSVVFKTVRWNAKLIGKSTDKTLGFLTPFLGETKITNEREAIRATLNGVIGDYLEENKNPLATKMEFRYEGIAISLDAENIKKTYKNVNGKILLMLHGSCMNDIQWTQKDHNHGKKISEELGKTPVYLNYNSGLHVSDNGKKLNELLENLVFNWPVPVEEINILGHSMGGLIARSTLHYGEKQDKFWTKYLKKIIFIGTPHHGAPLEKAGNIIDVVLETIPYARPFAKLGKIRSAGVTDLRYGNIVDEDWQHQDRFKLQRDKRQHIKLPEQIECYGIAGVVGKKTASISSGLLGDKMVRVKSALGKHGKKSKNLLFKKEHTFIAYETSHIELLSNLKIYEKMKIWLNE